MVIGTALGWGDVATIVLAAAVAYIKAEQERTEFHSLSPFLDG